LLLLLLLLLELAQLVKTIIFGNVHGDDDGACSGITDSVVCGGWWWHHRLCGARYACKRVDEGVNSQALDAVNNDVGCHTHRNRDRRDDVLDHPVCKVKLNPLHAKQGLHARTQVHTCLCTRGVRVCKGASVV
jgi:hypothetical protein